MTLLASVLRMVADHFPQLVYGHPHTYLVAEVYARGVPELALVPPPDKPWLDEIPRCPVWTLGGAVVLPEVGAEVMVMFRDADKRYPVVVAFAAGDVTNLDFAGGTAGVARVGDKAGRLIWDVMSLTLYYSSGDNPPGVPAPYVPIAVNPSTPAPPIPTDAGTPIVITTGSDIVGCG